MDPGHPEAHQVGLWRGRIVALDDAAAVLPANRVVDLQGATVLPGFIDAHVHLAWTGLRARSVSVAPCLRTEDVLDIIRRTARDRPSGSWVDIVGYDQRSLGRHLSVAELDAISVDHKLFVVHDSGHACVVNTAVLNLLPHTCRTTTECSPSKAWLPYERYVSPTQSASWWTRSRAPLVPAWPRGSPCAPKRASGPA